MGASKAAHSAAIRAETAAAASEELAEAHAAAEETKRASAEKAQAGLGGGKAAIQHANLHKQSQPKAGRVTPSAGDRSGISTNKDEKPAAKKGVLGRITAFLME